MPPAPLGWYYFSLSEDCRRSRRAGTLQHIFLDILNSKECKKFAPGINPRRELCAARKIVPSLKVFKFNMTDDEKGQHFELFQLTTKMI